MNASRLSRRLTVCGFAVLILAPTSVLAVPLPVGDTPISGTTSALRPELAGTVLEDVFQPYGFTNTAGTLAMFGTVQNRVVRSDVDGTLDFYWRIVPQPNPLALPNVRDGEIIAFRVIGFDGYALDGDWRIDGVGNVPPQIARNLGGGSVNFLFDPGVRVGEESRFFFLDTQATAYAKVGRYDLLGAPTGSISPHFETFVPVPEPSTLALLMFAAMGWCLRRRQAA